MQLSLKESVALEMLREKGTLTVGQPVARSRRLRYGLPTTHVLTSVAQGLERKRLVVVYRPEKGGPCKMTLANPQDDLVEWRRRAKIYTVAIAGKYVGQVAALDKDEAEQLARFTWKPGNKKIGIVEQGPLYKNGRPLRG
jgi:hypothetical protein